MVNEGGAERYDNWISRKSLIMKTVITMVLGILVIWVHGFLLVPWYNMAENPVGMALVLGLLSVFGIGPIAWFVCSFNAVVSHNPKDVPSVLSKKVCDKCGEKRKSPVYHLGFASLYLCKFCSGLTREEVMKWWYDETTWKSVLQYQK